MRVVKEPQSSRSCRLLFQHSMRNLMAPCCWAGSSSPMNEERYEVVVVGDGSCDGTAEWCPGVAYE